MLCNAPQLMWIPHVLEHWAMSLEGDGDGVINVMRHVWTSMVMLVLTRTVALAHALDCSWHAFHSMDGSRAFGMGHGSGKYVSRGEIDPSSLSHVRASTRNSFNNTVL